MGWTYMNVMTKSTESTADSVYSICANLRTTLCLVLL